MPEAAKIQCLNTFPFPFFVHAALPSDRLRGVRAALLAGSRAHTAACRHEAIYLTVTQIAPRPASRFRTSRRYRGATHGSYASVSVHQQPQTVPYSRTVEHYPGTHFLYSDLTGFTRFVREPASCCPASCCCWMRVLGREPATVGRGWFHETS